MERTEIPISCGIIEKVQSRILSRFEFCDMVALVR